MLHLNISETPTLLKKPWLHLTKNKFTDLTAVYNHILAYLYTRPQINRLYVCVFGHIKSWISVVYKSPVQLDEKLFSAEKKKHLAFFSYQI